MQLLYIVVRNLTVQVRPENCSDELDDIAEVTAAAVQQEFPTCGVSVWDGDAWIRLKESTEQFLHLEPAYLKVILPAAGARLEDTSETIMKQLFAPFPSDHFPTTLDTTRLGSLLDSPFAAKVPVAPTDFPLLDAWCPGLFEPSLTVSALTLAAKLTAALVERWPLGPQAGELGYTPFWYTVGYGLPEFVGVMLNDAIATLRNVADSSITLDDKKRDFVVTVKNVVVIAGEDKTNPDHMPKAEEELRAKHKGCNAALYGGLSYIIMIATAASFCRVYAVGMEPDAQLRQLQPQFEVGTTSGRSNVLKLFINLTRWLRTIISLGLLPPAPPAPLGVEFFKTSPYPGMPDVRLILRNNHVTKVFVLPVKHLQALADVYSLLKELRLPGAVKCSMFKADGNEIHFTPGIAPCLPSTRGKETMKVELELHPVAALFDLGGDEELRRLVESLLRTLKEWHKKGFVHRDIRYENILKNAQGWLLIDFELAGPADEHVWWKGKALPDDVISGSLPYTCKTDLWQISKLITGHPHSAADTLKFAERLEMGHFADAAEAEQNLWQVG